mmetsp:Transcript_17030/g.16896  ORF Transcript_17030/g.16896 Transcript_17030/m.16896 type:complete len:81 (+) Transcript_17030:13-255(+)
MNFWAFTILLCTAVAQYYAPQPTFGAGVSTFGTTRVVGTTTTLKPKGGKHKKKGSKHKAGSKVKFGTTTTFAPAYNTFQG